MHGCGFATDGSMIAWPNLKNIHLHSEEKMRGKTSETKTFVYTGSITYYSPVKIRYLYISIHSLLYTKCSKEAILTRLSGRNLSGTTMQNAMKMRKLVHKIYANTCMH